MKRVSVTELKNQLSRYLRLVKRGETIEIVERTVPIARLESVRGSTSGIAEHLERLRRDGIVRHPRSQPRSDLLEQPPIACSGDPSAVVADSRGDR
jgi:prevent-host-death family protein